MPFTADKCDNNEAIEPDILAMLAMSGRVTMLGISRWTGIGGSYRTMLRFFHTVLPWATLLWLFFRKHLWRENEEYLLVAIP